MSYWYDQIQRKEWLDVKMPKLVHELEPENERENNGHQTIKDIKQ